MHCCQTVFKRCKCFSVQSISNYFSKKCTIKQWFSLILSRICLFFSEIMEVLLKLIQGKKFLNHLIFRNTSLLIRIIIFLYRDIKFRKSFITKQWLLVVNSSVFTLFQIIFLKLHYKAISQSYSHKNLFFYASVIMKI